MRGRRARITSSLGAALLVVGCGASAVEVLRDDSSGEGQHHSSNEDLKWLSYRAQQFDHLVSRMTGRYRGPADELVLCQVLVPGRPGPTLYLERSEGGKVVERHLWLADPEDRHDHFQEIVLKRPPPAQVCDHDLPVALAEGSVGGPLRDWAAQLHDPVSLRTTVEGAQVSYERTDLGMTWHDAGRPDEPTSYRTMRRGPDGRWRPLEQAAVATDGSAAAPLQSELSGTTPPVLCADLRCPPGTRATAQPGEPTRHGCVRPDGIEHGPVLVCQKDAVLYRGQRAEGKRHGPWQLRGADGGLLAEGAYRDDRPDGAWRWHDLAGIVKTAAGRKWVGDISMRAWVDGGAAKPASGADSLVQSLAAHSRTTRITGHFDQGQLHGAWKTFDAQGRLISDKRFDQGFLSQRCSHSPDGTSECTRYLASREATVGCDLPSGSSSQLFLSRAQLASTLPCAASADLRWGKERLIGIPVRGRRGPAPKIRVEHVGRLSRVTVHVERLCGGARRQHSRAGTLWLVVRSDGRRWQLAPVQPICLRTP